MWSILAGIIGTLISAVVTGSVAARNRESQEQMNQANLESIQQTNEAQKDLAAQTNAWQAQQWMSQFNALNQYNLPANQIQRYRDAGINPALAMGGNLVDATASSPSVMSGHMASLIPFQGIAPQMSDAFARSLTADNAVKFAQADLMNSQASEIDTKLPHEVLKIKVAIDNANKDLEVKDAEISKMSMEEFYLECKNIRDDKYLELEDEKVLNNTRLTDAQIERYAKQNALDDAQISRIKQLNSLTARQLKEMRLTFAARLKGLSLENELTLAKIGLTKAQVSYYNELIDGIGYDNVTKRFDASKAESIMDWNQLGDIPMIICARTKFLINSLTGGIFAK